MELVEGNRGYASRCGSLMPYTLFLQNGVLLNYGKNEHRD